MTAFHRFDPAPCGFPPPRASLLPELHARSLALAANVLKAGARWYRRGRYALARAYQLAGVGPEGALLAPAYHCRTMLDPALAAGAPVLLYPVGADLAPDLSAVEALMSGSPGAVKALLVPHYFGFAQQLEAMMALCERHEVHLIEDCSHMLVGVAGDAGGPEPERGSIGHFGVASPYKFLPTPDGGLLWSNTNALPLGRLRSPSATEEAKAIANALRGAQRRKATLALTQEGDRAYAAEQPDRAAREWISEEAAPSSLYDPSARDESSLALSRWIARHTDLTRLVASRRAHYRRWLAATTGLATCRPLFPMLAGDCIPYMFPLLIDRPQTDFPILKRLGLPIWRWDEMAVSACPVASSYRLRLLHLPCHQELSEAEMRWMTETVASVCGRDSPDRDADDR